MAEYKIMYKNGDVLEELPARFERFRKAFQFINNGSSNGYTKYFAELAEVRGSNKTRFSRLRHPSVLVKIQCITGVRHFYIVDVEAEGWYDILRSLQEYGGAE